jgi:hypothetical protein
MPTADLTSQHRDLLAHAADALTMDTKDGNDEPYDGQSLAENILEAIRFDEVVNTDSRTTIASLLLQELEAGEQVSDPATAARLVADALGWREQPGKGADLLEALLLAAAREQDRRIAATRDRDLHAHLHQQLGLDDPVAGGPTTATGLAEAVLAFLSDRFGDRYEGDDVELAQRLLDALNRPLGGMDDPADVAVPRLGGALHLTPPATVALLAALRREEPKSVPASPRQPTDPASAEAPPPGRRT